MKITIDSEDVRKYGYAIPYYLSYIKQKNGRVTMKEMISDLDSIESTVRTQLDRMEKYGLIKRRYERIKGKRGGKATLVGIEIL